MKRILSLLLAFMMFGNLAYATPLNETADNDKFVSENIMIAEETVTSNIDNSDLIVKVVKTKDGVETTIYEGTLLGYDNGRWINTDFTNIDFLVIFEWESENDEAIYIIPTENKIGNGNIVTDADVSDIPTQEEAVELISNVQTISSISDTLKVNINLMYDETYYESVLLKDKRIKVPVRITNTSDSIDNITCYIAEYDNKGVLLDLKTSSNIAVAGGATASIQIEKSFDDEVDSVKIFVWTSQNMQPVTSLIRLNAVSADYYANSYIDAQEYECDKNINGSVNTIGDVDYIKYIADNTGEYTFKCLSTSDIYAELYSSTNTKLVSASKSFNYSLTEDNTYYIKIYGQQTTGEYIFSAKYNIPAEAENFDIYKFDVDMNIYKKSILETCDDLYYDDLEASKEMYNEYEQILSEDARLHTLPDFLSDHPKDLDNFDDLLNEYYGTKYDNLVEVRQKYIDLIDKYTVTDVAEASIEEQSIEGDDDVTELSENTNEEYPIIAKSPIREITRTSIDMGEINPPDGTQATQATPNLTVISKTATSITYYVTFPISGQGGNAIYLYNFNENDGITTWKNAHGTDEYRTNGQYTISNLQPGGIYILNMMWSTDGQTMGGENAIHKFVQLPNNTTETLKLYTGGRVTARMEQADKELATSSNFNTWLSRMDSVYNKYKDLTGYTPFNSQKIEMRSTRDNLNEYFNIQDGLNYYWVIYGYFDNTYIFKYGQAYYKGLMRRLSAGDWGWLPIHEMGHVFDNYKWNFDAETLAQFKSYYVMEQLNATVYDVNENEATAWYTGDEYYDYLKYNRFIQSYTNSFGSGTYASEGFAALLIDIQQQIGWEAFKKTFRYFNNLSYSQVPDTDGDILKLFLTKLKDYSGDDVLSYISNRDTGIIEDHFGIILEYVEPVYPTVSGGSSGGGGSSEVTVDKGSYTTYQFIPSDSANYYIYTSPYGGSGVSNDTYIEVYTNSSLSGTPIASNDDYDGGRFSKVSVAMTEGTTYYIKVRHYNNGQLHAELNITKDEPIQTLTVDDYEDVITAYGEYSLYSFTPETSGTYIFDITNYNGGTTSYDTYIKLYSNLSMTQRIGNDNTKIVARLEAGHTYYLQFSGFLMRYARGRINLRQGAVIEFTKRTDSNFIYVNSPEYITRFDMVDNNEYHDIMELTPKAKIAEFENVTGKNTLYETHTAWWGELVNGESYDPLQQFYMDIDFYNPTSSTITVSIENLAYGISYSDLQQYYNGGYSYDITIEPYCHVPIFSYLNAPLLCTVKQASEWARIPVILFDFTVHSGNVTISSLAAYDPQNLYLRSNTKNIVDATGAELNCGEILFGTDNNNNVVWGNGKDPRQNETDLYGKVKGIARNQGAWIDSNIELYVDDTINAGTVMPLTLKDSYYSYGISNPKWSWKSSINPLNDKWESLLMALPSGLHNFRYPYEDTGREWYFDFDYRDLRKIDLDSSRTSVNDPVPSDIIENAKLDMASGQKEHFADEEAPDEYSMSIGEWGATYHYTVEINNSSSIDRVAYVRTWSAENMIFGLKTSDDSAYTTTYYSKIYNTPDNPENTAIVNLPKGETTTFEFVTLLGGGLGGLNHSIVIE